MAKFKHIKNRVRQIGSTAKVVGSFAKEVVMRTVSPSYYKKRVIDPSLK